MSLAVSKEAGFHGAAALASGGVASCPHCDRLRARVAELEGELDREHGAKREAVHLGLEGLGRASRSELEARMLAKVMMAGTIEEFEEMSE